MASGKHKKLSTWRGSCASKIGQHTPRPHAASRQLQSTGCNKLLQIIHSKIKADLGQVDTQLGQSVQEGDVVVEARHIMPCEYETQRHNPIMS